MASKRISLKFKRRREGKTNYKLRLGLLKSNKLRLVVRKSLRNVNVQLIQYHDKGDKVLISANSRELIKFGWKGYRRNTPSAYLTGLLCGAKAKNKGLSEAVLDKGLHVSTKGSIIYAALKGAVDAGLKIPFSENLMPDETRIKGEHVKTNNNFDEVKSKIVKGDA